MSKGRSNNAGQKQPNFNEASEGKQRQGQKKNKEQ